MDKVYQSYYTESADIVRYMVANLDVTDGCVILEPCAGNGVFIDAILSEKMSISLEAYEMNDDAVKLLRKKYSGQPHITIHQSDTLLDQNLLYRIDTNVGFDRIIANPPYGAFQDLSKRKTLKKIYGELYVKDSYAVFLYQALKLLNVNGRLVFIMPDTYMSLNLHRKLRELLVNTVCIESICLFPSKFFPGVNFGYSKLSILTAYKPLTPSAIDDNTIKITNGYRSVKELNNGEGTTTIHISQKQVKENRNYSILVTHMHFMTNLLRTHLTTLQDVSDCVTGFYSGDDKKYIRRRSDINRGKGRYAEIDESQIFTQSGPVDVTGIDLEKFYIPFVKGGNSRFYKPNEWFINWSREAVIEYHNSPKARFQNSRYYFKQGIAIPMVSSTSITSSLLDNRLFDQSIVGVFPYEDSMLYFILGLFNSSIGNSLVRLINPTANNSANYLKLVPIVLPCKETHNQIDSVVIKMIAEVKQTGSYTLSDYALMDSLYNELYEKYMSEIHISK